MPERSFFNEEHIKLHGIGALQRRVLKDSPVTLHLNSNTQSRKVLKAYIDSEIRFDPQIATSPAPYVDFGGTRWRGAKKVLAVGRGLTAFDKSFSNSLKKMYTNQPKTEDTAAAEWLKKDTQFAWAFAEAIVEGRPMSPLSKEYQDRDESRSLNSFLAVGQADVDMRPLTMLRDADGNQNVLLNCDQRNIASWLAIADADQANRPYSEVNFRYHQQMLWFKSR